MAASREGDLRADVHFAESLTVDAEPASQPHHSDEEGHSRHYLLLSRGLLTHDCGNAGAGYQKSHGIYDI